MKPLAHIFRRKSLTLVLLTFAYIVVAGLVKWRLQPPLVSLLFLAGGLLGIFFLDLAEAFFKLTPSPFHSIVFSGLFSIVSFFIVTSSASLFASGLVLSLFLILILRQVGEWQVAGNLDSWYRMVMGTATREVQQWLLGVFIFIFLLETFLFVR